MKGRSHSSTFQGEPASANQSEPDTSQSETSNWQKREKTQETGRNNDDPHRMSSGYEKAEKELMAAKRKRLEEEVQSNPSVLLSPPSPIDRKEKSKYSRQKRDGSYTSEQTRIVTERIEELQKKQADESSVSDGRNDIVTVATGKHEHPGRVKRIGGGEGVRDYFGSSKRHKQSVITLEEMEHLLAAVRDEATTQARAVVEAKIIALRDEATTQAMAKVEAKIIELRAEVEAKIAESEASMTAYFQAEISKVKEELIMMFMNSRQETSVPIAHSRVPMQQSTKGSCCIIGQSESPELYDVFVEDPDKRLVARGTVHK